MGNIIVIFNLFNISDIVYNYIFNKKENSEAILKENIEVARITLGNIVQHIEDLEEELEKIKEENKQN